jgi:transcriptional regulator with XRE-family HTH domain
MTRPLRYKPVTVPKGVHPLLAFLFEQMILNQTTYTELAERSGVARNTIIQWRTRGNPNIVLLDACLGVFGYTIYARTIPDG